MLNKVQIIGNLGRDPEMKFTQNGSAVATFSVAASERWKDAEGKPQERTEWVNVVVWNKLAELCSEHLAKGRKVFLEGRLQTRSWDNKEGVKQYRTEVVANQVLFLDKVGAVNVPAEWDGDAESLPFD